MPDFVDKEIWVVLGTEPTGALFGVGLKVLFQHLFSFEVRKMDPSQNCFFSLCCNLLVLLQELKENS